MRLVAALLATAVLAPVAHAAPPRVAFTSDIDLPPVVPGQPDPCAPLESESWPIVAVTPGAPEELRGVAQAGGVRLSLGIASDDGGRTWRATRLPATSCAGGPDGRPLSVNPQVAAGPGGATWYGHSWVNPFPFAFSVDVLRAPSPETWSAAASPAQDRPAQDRPAQNLAIVPDSTDPAHATAVWTVLDQPPAVPGYAPAGSRVMAAATRDGGETWSSPVVAIEPGVDRYAVNVRAVRASDGAIVAIADRVRKEALATSLVSGVPAGAVPEPSDVVATRSTDGGSTWSEPKRIGPIEGFAVPDPDHDGPFAFTTNAVSVKPDIAAGPDEHIAVSAPLKPRGDRSSIMLAISRNGGRTWSSTRETFDVPALIQPAVAIDGKGRVALQWYDARRDRRGDEKWHFQPRMAVQQSNGRWAETALSKPFDLHATNACRSETSIADPITTSCDLDVDAMAIGVYPELVGLPQGFGAAYTVGPPLARDGFTDARYARVDVDPPGEAQRSSR